MTYHRSIATISRREELQAKIEDIENTLRNLREQLRTEEENDQHQMIDHLEDYFGEIDNKYANFREFLNVLRAELRELVVKGTAGEQEK